MWKIQSWLENSILVDFSPTFYCTIIDISTTAVMLGYDWWLCMVINISVYSITVGFSPTLYC